MLVNLAIDSIEGTPFVVMYDPGMIFNDKFTGKWPFLICALVTALLNWSYIVMILATELTDLSKSAKRIKTSLPEDLNWISLTLSSQFTTSKS
ncbi:hypothetical protein WICPIJ_007925 [Wickerhamomyces pijperi]|uniref:Uncharacterized protein n=1 Tax=Wickerhamomyces pijperi TaxID=599730 RepID=A0A9P8Q0W9_WICPI|nr:hypothetical protein WICPIJ_007925 [Wickerhamomyces pijperi]